MSDIESIAAATDAKPKAGGGYMGHCPAHDDRTPSLSIDLGENGRPVVKCWSGCSQESVLDALRVKGLWSGQGKQLSHEDMAQAHKRSDERIKARQKEQAAAAALSQTVLKVSSPAMPDNPYLERKRVVPTATLWELELEALKKIIGYHPKANGQPMAEGRILIVPLVIDSHISTIEMIDKDGLKSALSGGQKSGGHWASQRLPEGDGEGLTLQIGEGVSTVLSGKGESDNIAVAALSCGNLLSVARQMRARYPKAAITILADLVKTTGKPDPHAIEAAHAVSGKLATPDFGPDRLGGMTDFNDLAATMGRDVVKALIAAARPVESGTEDFPSSLNIQPELTPLNIRECLLGSPSPRQFLIRDYIPAGACGIFNGTGGTAKSYLSLVLSVALASGRTIPPFEIQGPAKVLIVNAEDGRQDIWFRLHHIGLKFNLSESEIGLLAENLIILPAKGIIGPLMQLDEKRNPELSQNGMWLKKQLDEHSPALVILDTKSRLYGLDENSNDHASQWITCLESMQVDHPDTSFLIISHTSKAAAQNGDHAATRGASAIGDNCRFGMALTWLDGKEAKSFGLKDHKGIIKLTHTKSSYSVIKEPVLFAKNPFGVPVMLDVNSLHAKAIRNAADVLVEILRADHPEGFHRRGIEKGIGDVGRNIRDMVLSAEDVLGAHDIADVVKLALDLNLIESFDDPADTGNRKMVLIRARQITTTDCEANWFGFNNREVSRSVPISDRPN